MSNFWFSLIFIAFLTINSSSARMRRSGINWNGNNWAMGCDFTGSDLSNAQIRSDDCGGRCAQTSGCTHFTWTTWNGGTCWMKKGTVSRNDAIANGDQSMVCGVIDTGSTGSSAAGTTTRYWDCCKPSCSWPGKVSSRNTNVNTCSKDGYGVIDRNAASGCGGGSSYVCNNQQPWAINNQLAYGFAAANIPGKSEQDWCCACYQLDFTSGPVQGQSLIVQVTNSGGDLGYGHFDLQIPGGGFGLFNGCKSQWSYPDYVWGQQYGGVGSRQSCYSLPPQIQSGCLFRFDWFKGADNPTMKYSKVPCPVDLTAKTGCSR